MKFYQYQAAKMEQPLGRKSQYANCRDRFIAVWGLAADCMAKKDGSHVRTEQIGESEPRESGIKATAFGEIWHKRPEIFESHKKLKGRL